MSKVEHTRAVNRRAKEVLRQGPALMTMHEATIIAKRQLAAVARGSRKR